MTSSVESDPLTVRVTDFVKEHMSHYDASHDFSHIERVVKLAQHIASCAPPDPPLDLQVVTLAALLHDGMFPANSSATPYSFIYLNVPQPPPPF